MQLSTRLEVFNVIRLELADVIFGDTRGASHAFVGCDHAREVRFMVKKVHLGIKKVSFRVKKRPCPKVHFMVKKRSRTNRVHIGA